MNGANGLHKLKDHVFSFQIGANYGLFSTNEILSNATAAINASDVNVAHAEDFSDIFSASYIQTAAGNRIVMSKYNFDEASRVTSVLDSTLYGSSIGGPKFDKDGDFFIHNKNASLIGIVRLAEDYSSVNEVETLNTAQFSQASSSEDKISFINRPALKDVFNVIDFSEEVITTNLSYYAPTDIADNSTMNIVKVSDTDYVIYYQNTAAGLSFKTLRIY